MNTNPLPSITVLMTPTSVSQTILPTTHVDGIPVVAEENSQFHQDDLCTSYPASFYSNVFSEVAKGMGPNPSMPFNRYA